MKHTNLRIVPLMLVLVLVISLVGCGKNKDENVPTAGDYSFQANEQYTFDGIEGDVSVTNEDGSSDTDSTGRVYGNNIGSNNKGSYNSGYNGGYKFPGSADEYTPGKGNNSGSNNNGGNNNNNNNNNNNSGSKYTLSELLAKVGDAKTYEEAIKKLNAMGIYPDKIIDGALKKYYDSLTKPTTTMDESKRNELESKFDDLINGIRPTKAPTTAAPVAE